MSEPETVVWSGAGTLTGREMLPLDRLLFGGSFDPPHRGHLAMAGSVLKEGLARHLDFIPAALSPFKIDDPPAPAHFRLEMLHRAIDEFYPSEIRERIRILELELHRPPPSYTVDTCEMVRREFPEERMGLLMGSDSFPYFRRWHEAKRILSLMSLVVFMRPGDDRGKILEIAEALVHDFADVEPGIRVLDNTLVDCSSTDVKAKLVSGADLRDPLLNDCLASSVIELIEKNNIYG